MYLFLALIWFLGAILVFGYELTTGDTRLRIRGTSLSIGWLILVLAAYNLARWWSTRAYRAQQKATLLAQAHRMRDVLKRPRPEPDPTFDFTRDEPHEPPPGPEGEREKGRTGEEGVRKQEPSG